MQTLSKPRRRGLAPKSGGFTLVEAMVSVGILSVLAALALPSFVELSDRWKVSSTVDDLTATLNLVRGSAIQNNGNVVLRKLTNAEAGLTNICNTTQNWSCGWRIFRDFNANGVLDTGEEVLYTFNITNNVTVMRSVNGDSMTANRWGQLSGINAVGFTLSPTATGASSPATTTVCMNSGGRIRAVLGSVTC